MPPAHRSGGRHVIHITDRAQLPGLIALYESAGAHHRVPLVRALIRGSIAFYEINRLTSRGNAKRFLAATTRRPAVALLGDDDHAATGPAGWPIAEKLLRWSRVVIVHGTGGEPWQYTEAVRLAGVYGTVAFVETSSAEAAAWVRLAQKANPGAKIAEFRPTSGVHPIAPELLQ